MKTYLGDGVYADFDGYHVVLTTGGNVIYLEPEVREAYLEYLGTLPSGWIKPLDDEKN